MYSLNINQKTIAWLSSVEGVSNNKILKLLEYFNNSPKDLWDSFKEEKEILNLLKPETIRRLLESKSDFEEKLLAKLNKESSAIVTIFDDEYPKKLRHISGAPCILYYRGSLDNIDNLSIAVIGSRKATAYGKWVAEKFTSELSELGVNIISGLAIGIDTIAHKTALKKGGHTYGVIGSGIDIVYPKNNESLYKEISEKGGAVITEYFFGTQPLPYNFHDRNRIISGLSDGVLVVEAQEKSGTLITVGHAANQGREIFAVPGNIDSFFSRGTNSLIKDGAKITTKIEDIVEEISELKEKINNKQNTKDYGKLTDDEIQILNCLKTGSKSLYEISEEIKLDTGFLLSQITLLEIKGLVKQISGNKYILQ